MSAKRRRRTRPKATPTTEPNAAPPSPVWLTSWRPYLVIALVGLAFHARTLAYGFTAHDDDFMVTKNVHLGLAAHDPLMAFTTDAWFLDKGIELYRPLQSLTYIVDFLVGGTQPFVYHATNLVFYVLGCCLVYPLLSLFVGDRFHALLATLLYSVHYLFVHAVAWIPARGDVLLASLCLASFLSFVAFGRHGRTRWLVVHMATFFLALLAKETAVMLPLVVIAHEALFGSEKLVSKRNALLVLGYAALTAAYLVLRNNAIAPASLHTGLLPLLANLAIIPETVSKFFVPVGLDLMPNINVRLTVSGTVIIAALVAFLFVTKELLNKVTLLGACWFLAFSLPAIAYRPAFAWYGYDYLDHRDFLPFVGLVLPLVSVAAKHQVLKKRPGQIAFAATTVVFAVVGARLRESYRNPFEYFSSAIRSNPTAMAYTTRGALWADNKDPRQAMDDFDNAIRLRPSFAKPWFNKGKLNMEQGNYPDAIDAFTRELKLEANDADARVGLGNAYAQTGNTAAALECYAKAIETGARADLAYFGRARIKKDERDYEGALDDLRKAIDLRPAFREAHFQMGLILASTGNFTASLGHIARAIDLDPGDPAQYYFRGRDWIELHDTAKACADFETAAKLGHSTAPQMLKRYCR